MQQPPPYGQQQPPFGMPPQQDVQPQEESDKIMAALSYILPILMSVIILVTDMKNKPFLKFHAYQSLVVGIAAFIIYTILGITVVGLCVAPLVFVAQVWFAYQAYAKGVFKIPGITDMTYSIFKDCPRV